MTEKKSSESRRKLLKSLAAGSGAIVAGKSLPDSWTKPVVDSVMLPVHAQTSQNIFFGPSDTDSSTAIQSDNLFADAMDTLVQPASAQTVESVQAHVCITDLGDGTVDVEAVIEVSHSPEPPYESARFSAKGIPANGTQQILNIVAHGCDEASLMDKLGLIQDAHAGNATHEIAAISVEILGTSAMGEVIVGEEPVYTLPYNVSGTTCELPELVCTHICTHI